MAHASSVDNSSARPRWHLIYYVLAFFDICALCVSLYVNHRIMRIYVDSVAADRLWVDIGFDGSQLGELAASIDAPGNEVFQSRDVAGETAKLDSAYREFKARMASMIANLTSLPTTDRTEAMLEDLKTVRSSTELMVRDAKLTLRFYEAGEVDRATQHMASMDRRYSTVNSTLVRLRSRISEVQDNQFESQTAAAAALQKSEYLIAGLITLMILGATIYGRVIATQVAISTRLKEQYQNELERRVEERTAELRSANDARADLLKMLITAQEDERRRIARDLHDGIGQSLTYLVVALRRLESLESLPSVLEKLGQLNALTSQTLDEVRRMARGLRPSVLDDLGLLPALERLVEESVVPGKMRIELQNALAAEQRLPEAQETAAYRIIQESLTNIAKHSGATEVRIGLRREADRLRVEIRDNGRGFVGDDSDAGRRTVGLSSIRERAAILGGRATITSRPDEGTLVQVELPIPPTAIDAAPRAVGH